MSSDGSIPWFYYNDLWNSAVLRFVIYIWCLYVSLILLSSSFSSSNFLRVDCNLVLSRLNVLLWRINCWFLDYRLDNDAWCSRASLFFYICKVWIVDLSSNCLFSPSKLFSYYYWNSSRSSDYSSWGGYWFFIFPFIFWLCINLNFIKY